MQVQTLPAAAGWRWLPAGFAIFRRNPPLLTMLVVSYWLTVLFLNVLPVIGALAASLVIPGLSVGLMQAARNLERGQSAGLQTLFGGLKTNTRTLVALGALYLCCTLGVLGLSALIDGGELLRFMLSGSPADKETIESGNLMLPALFVMILMLPVLMAYWFAPVLAAWHGLGVGKALFFSFVACWLNWRAFFTYSLGLLLVAGVIPGLVFALLAAVLAGGEGGGVGAFVIMPLMTLFALIVFSTVYASFYASYRDIFGSPEIV
ncbi:BPSS1780 family membrane protein [Dechloromonas sp. H13]|uniref:BPSS1780 family membrane protein n=1 Tax=Dechloromonas sp. H13 TaxID=2570193 RepID=UPI001291D139|nr:BPSS1780 family membrane protein [Dechloromonas sp. H13]